MSATVPGLDYTRVSEDAAILCKRRDFPRAINVLQRRPADHRRWRQAFRCLAHSAGTVLEGARRNWIRAAIRELVADVPHSWLRGELAVDLRAAGAVFDAPGVLPIWTGRQLWRAAEHEGLPMEYVVRVTSLPASLDAPLDAAQLVIDFRRTEAAHRAQALGFARALGPLADTSALSLDAMLARIQAEAQRDAAQRWRALASRILAGPEGRA